MPRSNVRIPVASWDPAKPLDALLAEHLSDVYDWPRKRTARLVRQGMVFPVLDGLDELPSNQRDALVPLLGRWLAGFPAHIVTCRRDAYDELSDGLRPEKWCTGSHLIRAFVPASE